MQLTNWKTLMGGLVLASAVALPGGAFADEHHGQHGGGDHGKGHHMQEMFDRMAEKLDLTEEQRAQLKTKREAHHDALKSLKKQKHELRDEIRTALDSGADQTKLDGLAAQLGAVELRMMQQHHQMHKELESVLTDEQKAKMEQMRSEHQERRMKRREERSATKQ